MASLLDQNNAVIAGYLWVACYEDVVEALLVGKLLSVPSASVRKLGSRASAVCHSHYKRPFL